MNNQTRVLTSIRGHVHMLAGTADLPPAEHLAALWAISDVHRRDGPGIGVLFRRSLVPREVGATWAFRIIPALLDGDVLCAMLPVGEHPDELGEPLGLFNSQGVFVPYEEAVEPC